MSASNGRDRGRYATALLATTYVIVAGLGICALIVVTSANEAEMVRLLVMCVGCAVGLWTLAWMLRDRRTNVSALSNVVWLAHRGKRRSATAYRPRTRCGPRQAVPIGSNSPPTVEQIRELSENVKTWVPSRARAKKHRESAGQERPL